MFSGHITSGQQDQMSCLNIMLNLSWTSGHLKQPSFQTVTTFLC